MSNPELTKFDNWLKLQGKAKNTRLSYCQRVNDFVSHVTELSQDNIDTYFLSLQDKFKNKTVNCYKDAISSYLSWKQLELTTPPSLKEPKTIPDAITLEEFEKQVKHLQNQLDEKQDKIKAIFYLLFYSGLRPSEIVALKRKDIDLENHQGKVYRQKTGDEFIFLFNDKVKQLLKIYFLIEEEKKNAFNTNTRAIGRMCEKIKKHFPSFNLRPYLFRHSSATHLLDEKFNLLEIQEFLGHKNSRSTEKYLKITKERIKQKYLERIK